MLQAAAGAEAGATVGAGSALEGLMRAPTLCRVACAAGAAAAAQAITGAAAGTGCPHVCTQTVRMHMHALAMVVSGVTAGAGNVGSMRSAGSVAALRARLRCAGAAGAGRLAGD